MPARLLYIVFGVANEVAQTYQHMHRNICPAWKTFWKTNIIKEESSERLVRSRIQKFVAEIALHLYSLTKVEGLKIVFKFSIIRQTNIMKRNQTYRDKCVGRSNMFLLRLSERAEVATFKCEKNSHEHRNYSNKRRGVY